MRSFMISTTGIVVYGREIRWDWRRLHVEELHDLHPGIFV